MLCSVTSGEIYITFYSTHAEVYIYEWMNDGEWTGAAAIIILHIFQRHITNKELAQIEPTCLLLATGETRVSSCSSHCCITCFFVVGHVLYPTHCCVTLPPLQVTWFSFSSSSIQSIHVNQCNHCLHYHNYIIRNWSRSLYRIFLCYGSCVISYTLLCHVTSIADHVI